jgi:hypothetical protein
VVTCAFFDFPNGTVAYTNSNTSGSVATFACEKGMQFFALSEPIKNARMHQNYARATGLRPIGSSTLECTTNGQWNGSTPTCEQGKRPQVFQSAFSSFVFRTMNQTCLLMYGVVFCPLLSIKNGSVSYTSNRAYQALALYSCDAGSFSGHEIVVSSLKQDLRAILSCDVLHHGCRF